MGNVIKLRNCNPAPVILEQAFGARFFAALENDSPKRAAKDLGGGGASCFLNLMTLVKWDPHRRYAQICSQITPFAGRLFDAHPSCLIIRCGYLISLLPWEKGDRGSGG